MYYEANKETILEKSKAYYKNNKETVNTKKKEYYMKNREKIKQYLKRYVKENKDSLLTSAKNYRESNRETISINYKKYAKVNKEKIQKYKKEYQQLNKEILAEKRKCVSCKLFQTNNPKRLCSYCNPEKMTKRSKTKELFIKKWLEDQNYQFVYNKKCNLDKSCQTYYPDFLIDCDTFFLVIECDEHGHYPYDYNCERIRENNICFALGLPCVFIRYNPDKKGVKKNVKLMILKSYIEYYKTLERCDNETTFLFY